MSFCLVSGCRQQATLAGAAQNERTEEKTREHKKCTSRKKKEQKRKEEKIYRESEPDATESAID